MTRYPLVFPLLVTISLLPLMETAVLAELRVHPRAIEFDRPENSCQLVVTSNQSGRDHDVTRNVRFDIEGPAIVKIDPNGLVQPLAEGTTQIVVRSDDLAVQVPVSVTGLVDPPDVSFRYEVQPLLTKARCNSGGCHGKAEGQNGFKLSLLGFDALADHEAIVKETRGRRLSFTDPDSSLLLRKAAALVPHGGGLKIDHDSRGFRRLRRWIGAGAPLTTPTERPVVRIEVEPAELTMRPGEEWQLRVTAIDEEGRQHCATAETDYISNAPHIADVSGTGLLQATDIPGDAAILVRYLEHVAVCRVVSPRPGTVVQRPEENNFIDRLVWDKLVQLGIPPSELADDGMFLRRVYLDVIGTLPTADEARQFLADPAADKRAKLIQSLLQRPEYADYWAMNWSNLLRADRVKVTAQGTVGITRWLHRQFAENRPYDEMVREILTVQGAVTSESPAAFFKAVDQPEAASRSVSQLLLGVRIECAQCHHHPSERWSQEDYVAFAGLFSGLSVKKLPGGIEAVVARAGTDLKHPRTDALVPARPLGAAAVDLTGVSDRRQILADWMTAPDNPFFARAAANRIWAHYFGRGLVEPVDDLRATNPATNEPLLDALAQHLRDVDYDLRAFTATLLNSRVYQLSSAANELNRDDRQHFSHARPKSLPAEVLLDAICQVTGVPEKFNGWPLGARSIEIWDNRMPSYFFRIFGRPVRATVCECERSNEPSISQALHLLNSPEINEKITHRDGQARRIAQSSLSVDEMIDQVYLITVSRYPTDDERLLMQQAFEEAADSSAATSPAESRDNEGDVSRSSFSPATRQAVEDVLWAVLNTKEFLYNH